MNVTNEEETGVDTVEKLQVPCAECRVCLKKCNDVWELFHGTTEDIPRKLMACAAVQVEEGDGLPTTICQTCRRLLDVSYEFKCQVERSDSKLREIIIFKDPMEEAKIDARSVDAVVTEVMEDETVEERSTDVAVECAELVDDLADPTDRLVTSLNDHHFAVHDEPIIFQIQPPAEQDESTLEREMKLENSACNAVNEKYISSIDCQQNRAIDTLIEKYEELGEPCMEPGRLKREEAMDTDESEISDDESVECRAANVADNENVERTTAAEEIHSNDAKDDTYESDEEEKPLINRTLRQKCPQCIKTFATRTALERHAEIHKTKLRYVCYMCDKQFPSISKLKSHVLSSHDSLRSEEKTVAEEDTRETTRTERQQQSSKSESKKNLKFPCKVCGKQFTYQKSFMTHAKTHPGYEPELTNEKEEETIVPTEENSNERGNESEDDDMPVEGLQCTQCGKLFATKRNLKRHISTHSGLKFHCSTCGKEFSRVDKLKEHEQSKHNEELFASSDSDSDDYTDNENKNHDGSESRKKEKLTRPHQCPMCPKAFAQEQSLTNHMERHKRVKDTQKRFLCEVCSKCFAQSGSLVAHMRTHTGVKPYVCNVCSRAFTKSTYLQLHLRTHSGEKPYICQYCSRAFARANTLARHITMHTGEAKYHCQICTKSFRRLTSLNEHTYTHTGQRPYACKICTKRYNNAGSLYAHTKKCKAQQLSGGTTTYTVPVDDSVHQNGGSAPQMMVYSQRKLVDDTTTSQVTPPSQFMIANVHNPSLKSLPPNIIPQFAVEDPNFCTVNKPYKNPYYTIYPNM